MQKQATKVGKLAVKGTKGTTKKGPQTFGTAAGQRGRSTRGAREQKQLEEEVKVPERKRIILDRSQVNIHTLNGESKEMKDLVRTVVKSPKRRSTTQNVTQVFGQGKKLEQEDWEERQQTMKTLEESKQRRLEWRAQYSQLVEVEPRREKSEVKKVEGDLIRIVHTEESESQIQPRLRESFWEKIGFKDKRKQEKNLIEAKEKIDNCFRNLKVTAQNNYENYTQLEESRKRIKEQQAKKEELEKLLEQQKQLLIKHEKQIINANQELAEQQSKNQKRLLDKHEEVRNAEVDLQKTKQKLEQEHETAIMRLEDQSSKYFRVKDICDQELQKNQELHNEKVTSQILAEEEQQINVQLAMSKPLVTEIMEYFNRKETESAREEKVETLVEALQVAIEECLIAEQKFQKAAYYDANKFLPFERTQRTPYTEKLKFNQ